MTTRAIVALGIGQCVNWGVLYYAFGVLLTPLQHDLDVPAWVIAAAFSLALFMSALAAPAVGRWSDRGAGPTMVRIGGYVSAALLLLWTVLPDTALFLVWAALGLCMAATLYEPVFVIIGRALRTPTPRLRALATVTVFGGLASTVFLPLTAILISSWGWRTAVAILAGTLAVSTYVCSQVLVGSLEPDQPASDSIVVTPETSDARFRAMLGLFGIASLASTAFTTTLVPALVSRELTPLAAASVGGLLGLMQLPGRVLVMHGALSASPSRLIVASLLAQAAGIFAIAISATTLHLAAGVTSFAVGAGLMTLARPHLVQTLFAVNRAGHLNGRLAGAQNVARAGGPILAVGLASVVGYGAMFGVLAAVVAALAVTWVVVVDV